MTEHHELKFNEWYKNDSSNINKSHKTLTSRPAFLSLLIICLEEYLLPGTTLSLYDSSRGALEGIILSMHSPSAGQSNQRVKSKKSIQITGISYNWTVEWPIEKNKSTINHQQLQNKG